MQTGGLRIGSPQQRLPPGKAPGTPAALQPREAQRDLASAFNLAAMSDQRPSPAVMRDDQVQRQVLQIRWKRA